MKRLLFFITLLLVIMGCGEPDDAQEYLGTWEVISVNSKPVQNLLRSQNTDNTAPISIVQNEWYFDEAGQWSWYLQFEITSNSHRFHYTYEIDGTFSLSGAPLTDVKETSSIENTSPFQNLGALSIPDGTHLTLVKTDAKAKVGIVFLSDPTQDTTQLENAVNMELDNKLSHFLFTENATFDWEVVDDMLSLTASDLEISLRSREPGVLPIR